MLLLNDGNSVRHTTLSTCRNKLQVFTHKSKKPNWASAATEVSVVTTVKLLASVLLIIVSVIRAYPQGLHLGLKAGVPITEYFETGSRRGLHGGQDYSAATRRYTVGAGLEWQLTNPVRLELDAMFHRMGYVGIVNFFDSASGSFQKSAIDVKGDSWDFPLTAKYRFRRALRPYLAGGPALRYVGPVRGRGQQTAGSLAEGTSSTTSIDTTDPSELKKRFYPGLTAATGVEFGEGRFHVSPEIRYTRWVGGGPGGLLRFPNQVEFLVGFWF
ncbi:MAG TPA: outer membrane beta-barrel protein [Bryobacteraceae bacterium]|nr:outer membrane beta-barrel protein [Bryobacteraceae bacterium]